MPRVDKNGEQFAFLLRDRGLQVQTEYKFALPRKFRADIWIVGTNIIGEVDGGIWSHGRHVRGSAYASMIEKFNLAAERGLLVVRCTPDAASMGRAVDLIEKMVGSNVCVWEDLVSG